MKHCVSDYILYLSYLKVINVSVVTVLVVSALVMVAKFLQQLIEAGAPISGKHSIFHSSRAFINGGICFSDAHHWIRIFTRYTIWDLFIP